MHEQLQKREEKLRKYGLTNQPKPVVVGPVESPTQYLIVLDNFHYEALSPLHAVDGAFKLYHALNAHCPPEAEHIWLFLQKAIFKISLGSTRAFGDVECLLNEFSQFQV